VDVGAEGAQHWPGEPGVPFVPEQVVLVVKNTRHFRARQRLSGSVRRGLLHADATNPLRLHRLRKKIQMARQPEKAPEGGLRQQRKKVLLSRVRPKVQISIRITESYHRASRRVTFFSQKVFENLRIQRT